MELESFEADLFQSNGDNNSTQMQVVQSNMQSLQLPTLLLEENKEHLKSYIMYVSNCLRANLRCHLNGVVDHLRGGDYPSTIPIGSESDRSYSKVYYPLLHNLLYFNNPSADDFIGKKTAENKENVSTITHGSHDSFHVFPTFNKFLFEQIPLRAGEDKKIRIANQRVRENNILYKKIFTDGHFDKTLRYSLKTNNLDIRIKGFDASKHAYYVESPCGQFNGIVHETRLTCNLSNTRNDVQSRIPEQNYLSDHHLQKMKIALAINDVSELPEAVDRIGVKCITLELQKGAAISELEELKESYQELQEKIEKMQKIIELLNDEAKGKARKRPRAVVKPLQSN